MNDQKKKIVIFLFSALLLGGVGYAMTQMKTIPPLESTTQEKPSVPLEQPPSKSSKESSEKQGILDRVKKPAANVLDQLKESPTDDRLEKAIESQGNPDLLTQVFGNARIFLSDNQVAEELAAFDQAAKKADQENQARLLSKKEKEQEASEEGTAQGINEGKLPIIETNEELLLNQPVLPKEPEGITPDYPEQPTIPSIPSEPIPAEPVIPEQPEPMLDQLVDTNKLSLTEGEKRAEALNQSLERLKQELDQVTMIEKETTQQAEQATEKWQKVAALVKEYNALSEEINSLLESDGQVLPINVALYQEIYAELHRKVDEIKDVQQQANQLTEQMTEQMTTSVQQAQETVHRLPEMVQEYQELQAQVSTTTADIQTAVSTAQEKEQVAEAVQPEIAQATRASEQLVQTNQDVGQQVEKSQEINYQPILEQATQRMEQVTNEAVQQNEAVAAVMTDFQSVPIVDVQPTVLTSSEVVETQPADETVPVVEPPVTVETPENLEHSLNE